MSDDMMQMQQAAARRVKRMQEQNRRIFEEHQGRTADSLAAARPPAPPSPATEAKSDAADPERLLLLGLAAMLFRGGCKPELAAALLYLAM